MYSEWGSLQDEIQSGKGKTSVLNNFPPNVGRDVANVVVRSIAGNLSLAAANDEPSGLKHDKDVKWTMEVLCFGLGLPLTEHETINDCVKVYCEWLTALIVPKRCVPAPVVEDPNPYAQDILQHLLNLFKPRLNTGVDLVKRQALFCHRVLRAIEGVAKESSILTRATWESLLKFLLAATDNLLSPPTEKDDTGLSSNDIGDHLCERVLSVLFGIWMISCSKCFPSPSLWKTFSNMCMFWRHHEALVIQWHKINHALTSLLVKMMYGPNYPELHVCEDDAALIPTDTSDECITQCWFRFLHIIQNPVDLSKPMIIGNTQRFLQYALTSQDVVEPSQHECLQKLPMIFFKAMRGISIMINAFLGLPQSVKEENLMALQSSCKQVTVQPSTPPGGRKIVKPMQVLAGTLTQKSQSKTNSQFSQKHMQQLNLTQTQLCLDHRLPFPPSRPRCNSLLHLFGNWLFDAALVGVKLHSSHSAPERAHRTSSFLETLTPEQISHDVLGDNTYETGRAEACGTLCRMLSSHKTGEDILPVYFSRFYLCMYYGLQTDENNISGQVLTHILFNSCDLLRVDLAGIQILVPYFLNAIELVLRKSTSDFSHCEHITYHELRKACIHLLLSMLCLPLHFKNLEIKSIQCSQQSSKTMTFLSLKPRITDLLQKALSNETESSNTQMLLGGLMLLVQDMATCEEAERQVNRTNKEKTRETNTDSAYWLFGHATSLVCNRLMASWKSELNTALAAMELLAGLAKVSIYPPNTLMCKRTVKWICDFIVYQCSRPAPSHSRDLHSMIVAAFKCLLLWLVEHSTLLYDKECLHNVLEVVELGISGSKSQGNVQESLNLKSKVDEKSKNVAAKNRASDPPKFKGDKQLMPASMRVKDAAEAVLTCIIDQVGAFPPPCGPESLFSLLDEKSLLRYTNGNGLVEGKSPFRYYVIDNSIIVGLLEQPLGSVEDPLPTVTALIRGPFGRHAWTMQLRHSPRNQKGQPKDPLINPGRPTPNNNVGVHHNVEHRYFPESIDKIPLTKADKSIPPMDVLKTDDNREDLEKLVGYIEQSMAFEKEVSERERKEREATPYPDPVTECKPPKICNEYQTARLFLSHYGFLSLECLKEPSNSSVPPALVMLNISNPNIFSDLEALDRIPSRDNDTLHIFYVKSGQRSVAEILPNVLLSTNVQPQFLEFLHSLGWPVDVRKHAGWTGHVSTSWRTKVPDLPEEEDYPTSTGGSVYDGRQQVLYWADVSSEMAFVVPSPQTNSQRITSPVSDGDKSPEVLTSKSSLVDVNAQKPKPSDADKVLNSPGEVYGSVTPARVRRLGRQPAMGAPEVKVFAVWLESFEDHDYIPTADLVHVAHTGQDPITSHSATSIQKNSEREVYIIFIHALQNGLFRIHMRGTEKTKMSLAIPLVDGMLVSRRTLGTLVRQTAINICRRKRMESELYQPPHVRRKFKIQEIVNKYRMSMTEAEFYAQLFEAVPE